MLMIGIYLFLIVGAIVLLVNVLFEGEADEYTKITNDNPISHDDCIKILKAASKLKSMGLSTELIVERLRSKNKLK